MANFFLRTVFGLVIFGAIAFALTANGLYSAIPVQDSSVKKILCANTSDANAQIAAVVDVIAYVRSSSKLHQGDINWMFAVSSDEVVDGWECYFEPCASIENMAMSNPDGSPYYVGVMKGRIFIRRSEEIARANWSPVSVSSFIPRSDYPPEPTIILEGRLSSKGFDLAWSAANIANNACSVLFKYLDPNGDSSPSLLCFTDFYCI